MSTFQAPYKAVLVSLYEYAIQSENEKLCGKIKEVFDLQFDDLPNRFRRLGLDDSLVCPSYGRVKKRKFFHASFAYEYNSSYSS